MIQIFLNWLEVTHFENFRLSRSIWNFVDDFSVSIGNVDGKASTSYPIGSYVNILNNWVEIFRGVLESKEVSWENIGSKMQVSWREELVFLTEDDLPPTKWNYKGVSDNFIIEDICSGYWWTFNLDEAKKIDEYEVSSSGVRKWQVIESVCGLNNFYFFKKWVNVYKRKLPTVNNYWSRVTAFKMTKEWWEFHDFNNRILGVTLSEDIQAARTTIKGYVYAKDPNKTKLESVITNPYIESWTYARRLRNLTKDLYKWISLKRTSHINVIAKNKKDLDSAMLKARIQGDIKIKLTITVAWIMDLDIIDAVEVSIEEELISQYFYVDTVVYRIDQNNKTTTEIVLVPVLPADL